MATDNHAPKWRNFLRWSATGAIFYVAILLAAGLFQPGATLNFTAQSGAVVAKLGLAGLLSAAVFGLSMRKMPFHARNLRNQLVLTTACAALAVLALLGVRALLGTVSLSISATVALILGVILFVLAMLGLLVVGAAHARVRVITDEQMEDLRERSRMTVYSFISMISMGFALAVLALGGPGGLVPPAAALAGALVLLAVSTLLSMAVRPLMDELMRALSRETAAMSFYLAVILGGGWAMLAHLGFVGGAAPLDWLTMFTLFMYAASFIAIGRRGLLKR